MGATRLGLMAAAALLLASHAAAFTPGVRQLPLHAAPSTLTSPRTSTPTPPRMALPSISRRDAAVFGAIVGASAMGVTAAEAAPSPKNVLVVGATGKTGKLVVAALSANPAVNVIAGVRDEKSGKSKALKANALRHVDVTEGPEQIALALDGIDTVICALGFVPGSPFEMNKMAHAVDNVGTCKLIDASVAAGVSKFVLVTSILTNGRAWGQEKSPGFVITNAFGGVLDEKLAAEKALKASGMDYTIVRPGGLRDEPTQSLIVSGEDTLNSGEVSRKSVAAVCAAAIFSSASSRKVVEIFESETAAATPAEKWFA